MSLNKEYEKIANPIIYNENFILLKNDTHHGTTKYNHCKRVSYLSFLMSKIFRCDTKSVTRAGLLHDFFYGTRTSKEENDYLKHPITSVKNAKKYFKINTEEESIIKSHMYHYALVKRITPFMSREDKEYFNNCKPKNKESVIVCISDLLVSIYEVCIYKIKYSFALYVLFLINNIK